MQQPHHCYVLLWYRPKLLHKLFKICDGILIGIALLSPKQPGVFVWLFYLFFVNWWSELLESVPTSSVQYQREILQVLQQSYQDRKSTDRFIYSQPKLVHNAPLLNEVSIRLEIKRRVTVSFFWDKDSFFIFWVKWDRTNSKPVFNVTSSKVRLEMSGVI